MECPPVTPRLVLLVFKVRKLEGVFCLRKERTVQMTFVDDSVSSRSEMATPAFTLEGQPSAISCETC